MGTEALNLRKCEKEALPLPLLLEADPSIHRIQEYLGTAWCFSAELNDSVVGACVAGMIEPDTAEVYNLCVDQRYRRQGIGTELLNFSLNWLRQAGVLRVELGTGTFGPQIDFYRRIGFEVCGVIDGYFLSNYPEPIFEDGRRHKDMLRMVLAWPTPDGGH